MRYVPISLLANGDMSDDLESIGIDMNQIVASSIQAVFTGSPEGRLQLEVSNDIVLVASQPNAPAGSNPAANVVNWSVHTASIVDIDEAGDFTWDIPQLGFRWLRLTYNRTDGSGALNVTFSGKGV